MKRQKIETQYILEGSENISLIKVDANMTVAGFLDEVKEKNKNDDLCAVFLNCKKLDGGDLLANWNKPDSIFIVTDKDTANFTLTHTLQGHLNTDEKMQEIEKKIRDSTLHVVPSSFDITKMTNQYQIYTTAKIESMLAGNKLKFKLQSTANEVKNKIVELVRGFNVDGIPDDFEVIVYLPGGVPFISGTLSDWYEATDVSHHRLYVVVTKQISHLLDEEIIDPCCCKGPVGKLCLSPLYDSNDDGLAQLACFLGYLFHDGLNSEHLLLVLAKLTRFAPLLTNIFRLIEHVPLNILNIVSITAPLHTLFMSILPKKTNPENVFEKTLGIITFIGLIRDTEFLSLSAIDWEDDPKDDESDLQKYYRETQQQNHVIHWEEDTINPGFEGFNLLAPDTDEMIETIMETIPTYKPLSPMSLHYVYSPTFMKGVNNTMLFLCEIQGRPNWIRFIDPLEGQIKEANLVELAKAINDNSVDDLTSMIDPNRVEQIVFIIFDESTSMKWKLEGGVARKSALTRAQIATQYLHALLAQTYKLRVSSILGLISFGSSVNIRQPLTPIATDFADKLKDIEPNGNTLLWDAMKSAHDQLVAYNTNADDPEEIGPNFKNARLRIIAITDGKDNKSATLPEKLATELIENRIVVDTVLVSLTDQNLECCAMSKLTGGLAFRPKDLKDGLKIFEQEAFLNINCRKNYPQHALPITAQTIEEMSSSFQDYDLEAPNQEILNATIDIILSSPMYACFQYSQKQPATIKKRKALLYLNSIAHHPDERYKVFASYATPEEWRVFIKGPEDTPYEGKWLNLFVTFPDKYPVKPPTFRFLTVPFHPNVTHEGKVNFSLVDKLYTPRSDVDQILKGIVELISNPEEDSAVNSEALMLFTTDKAQFKARQEAGDKGADDYKEFIKMEVYEDVPENVNIAEEEELSQLYFTNTLNVNRRGKELAHPDVDLFD